MMLDRSAAVGPWVIVIDEMSYDQAFDVGRVLGSKGIGGRFVRGTVADNMAHLARLKAEGGRAGRGSAGGERERR